MCRKTKQTLALLLAIFMLFGVTAQSNANMVPQDSPSSDAKISENNDISEKLTEEIIPLDFPNLFNVDLKTIIQSEGLSDAKNILSLGYFILKINGKDTLFFGATLNWELVKPSTFYLRSTFLSSNSSLNIGKVSL